MEDLGRILDDIAFMTMSQKQRVERVLHEATINTHPSHIRKEHIVREIVDYYAGRYGTLGITRRRLVELVMKEVKKAYRKERAAEWARLWENNPTHTRITEFLNGHQDP
jgi:hypothetical protein